MPIDLLFICDLIGTFAFAVTGVIGGLKKRLDIVGAMFCALSPALAGGIVRDAILGVHSATFSDERYLIAVVVATLLSYLCSGLVLKYYRIFLYADAIGLAVFTLIGVHKAITYDLGVLAALFLGCITAVGGGMIRDILIQEVPMVLQRELYAVPSLCGGAALLLLYPYIGWEMGFAVTGVFIFVFRVIAIECKWGLSTKQIES